MRIEKYKISKDDMYDLTSKKTTISSVEGQNSQGCDHLWKVNSFGKEVKDRQVKIIQTKTHLIKGKHLNHITSISII